jgi:hypothetical protein
LRLVVALLTLVAIAGAIGTARADRAETLRSYWNADRTRIYSDVAVTRDDGTTEVRRVPGGSVDGIGMIQIALLGDGSRRIDFVPSTTTSHAPLRWAGSCVFLTPDAAGSKAIAFPDELAAILAAAGEWNDAAGTCSYLRLIVETPEPHDVAVDGRNVIKFREDVWAHGGRVDVPEDVFSPDATAITTIHYVDGPARPDNGIILDADIEINGIDFAMATGCERTCVTRALGGAIEDLQNTLTHELGHVIGLGHTCFVPDPRHPGADLPVDGTGKPIPSCDLGPAQLGKTIVDATMYNYQAPMETSKRTLSPDDVDGACHAYPIALDPGVCAPVSMPLRSGCAVAPGGPRGAGGLDLALVAAAVLLGRRRAARSSAAQQGRRVILGP